MPMDMQPNEMAEMQDKMGKDNSGGISKLAQEIADKLGQFKEAVDNSDSTTDKDRSQMDQMMQLFVSLVENQLGQSPGEDQEEQGDQLSQIPMDQGINGKQMGPQTKE